MRSCTRRSWSGAVEVALTAPERVAELVMESVVDRPAAQGPDGDADAIGREEDEPDGEDAGLFA